LVNGASGFIGTHCARALRAINADVVTINGRSADIVDNINSDGRYVGGDIRDRSFVLSALNDARPAIIFHLAGLNPVAHPKPTAIDMLSVNALGTLTLLEGIGTVIPKARVLIFSSSSVYGEGQDGMVDEKSAIAPVNDYGASKAAQEFVATAFSQQHGTDVIRVRTFNLLGPGEPAGLVCSAIASQIASSELGLTPPVLRVGNLNAQRDFTDVRDVVLAYLLIGAQGRRGEVYNVCSGRTVAIAEILERLLAMSQVNIKVVRREDSTQLGSQVRFLRGSYERLNAATGWQPHISLDESLRSLLDWWRSEIGNKRDTGEEML
jgi:GDP-4-dehydro-6-deoxy-D-mannose reductase